jgi:hypothetical protein
MAEDEEPEFSAQLICDSLNAKLDHAARGSLTFDIATFNFQRHP